MMVISSIVLLLVAMFAPLRSQPAAPADLRAAVIELKDAVVRSDTDTLSSLFSDDVDLWTGGAVRDTGRSAVARTVTQRAVWSERSPAYLKSESIRLVSRDVALIDAQWVRYGSTDRVRDFPVLFILKREGSRWLVASIRVNLRFSALGLGHLA